MGGRSCQLASSQGHLANIDLMEFLATTTFGACLSQAPQVDTGYEYRLNVYHQAFLTWGFHKSIYGYYSTQTVLLLFPVLFASISCILRNWIDETESEQGNGRFDTRF